jgi:ABC-type branched-subunit amino acid transport system substrate-binding protein
VRHGLSRTADPASQRDDHPEEKRPMIPLERVARGMIAVVALATFMGGAGSSAAQPAGPLKIGFIYPDNGPMAQLGLDLRDGFLLYWSEVGQKAGGRPVEVLVETKASCKPTMFLTHVAGRTKRIYFNFGLLSHRDTLRAMERFAKEVLPHFGEQ